MRIRCAGCRTAVELPGKVGFRDTCPSCEAWLHSCVNCEFLVSGQCTEPAAEKIRDPEGMNYCEWYRGIDSNSSDKREEVRGRDDAEELWKKLTKK